MTWRLFTALLLLMAYYSYPASSQDLDSVIAQLAMRVADSQIKKPAGGLEIFKKQVGVYPCNIRLNFNGDPSSVFTRDSAAIFDNNAFVTLWVSSILLEVEQFVDIGPRPSSDQLSLAIDAIGSYHDCNLPQEDGILVFWPQKLNSTNGLYYCSPRNVKMVAESAEDILQDLHTLLDDLGLEKFWEKTLKEVYMVLNSVIDSYHIPADSDDTFVNLGFGFLLSQRQSQDGFKLWQKRNWNRIEVMKALKKYAYRPFSNDTNSNLIDTRTYFYLRDYLYDIQQSNKHLAVFATTWSQNLEEERVQSPDISMPFYVNNVDLTVSANVLYGLTTSVLMSANSSNGSNGIDSDWFDSDLQIIYENTTDLICWFIERNFSSRPDLALTYYPSVFNFYWFTSRVVNLLRSHFSTHGSFPFSVMSRVMSRLTFSLRDIVTNTLLKRAISDKDGLVYFEDFLGMKDESILGKPVNHAEDRVCSTAVAINALLYTWTENHELVPSIPIDVKTTVVRACEWLLSNTLSEKYKKFNVLFSGSVKLVDELPFYFPTKDLKYINGTAVPPDVPVDKSIVIGVHGVIPKEEYDQLLKKGAFGKKVTVDFHGYNQNVSWPFWSSEPFTYASVMLALTQYKAYYGGLH